MAKVVKNKRPRKSATDVASAMVDIERTNAAGVDGLLDSSLLTAINAANSNNTFDDGVVLTASEALAQLICIPMPALAPRFLFQGEGFPLCRVTLLTGFRESCKSAFMSEIGLWHRAQRGSYVVIETEEKDGTDLRDSFFNYDRNAWFFSRGDTQEAWQQLYFWWVDRLREIMDGFKRELTEEEKKIEERKQRKAREKAEADGMRLVAKKPGRFGQKKKTEPKVHVPGTGRKAPVCIGVDSISAVLIDKFAQEMLDNGSPELHHPQHARLLSDFLKVAPKRLARYPMSLVMVSHLRETQHHQNPNIKNRVTTGGAAPGFQASLELDMRRKGAHQGLDMHPDFGELHSIPINIRICKNSLAPHEFITVPMCWYFDQNNRNPITGEPRQRSFFDWHTASLELLKDCMRPGEAGKGFSTQRAKDLRDLLDLGLDENKRKAWSKTLGVSSDDRMTYQKLGELLEAKIQSDAEFRKNLYSILGIRRRYLFKPGVDMLDQIAENEQGIVASALSSSQILADMSKDVTFQGMPGVNDGESE